MQELKHTYVAKAVDTSGRVDYSTDENAVWTELFNRQRAIVQDRACQEFIEGISALKLAPTHIPQCYEVTDVLQATTGWSLQPVPALISFDYFFELLAAKKFPAATFIRRKEDLDYIQEPDIFHEIFGHCPLLTNPAYAAFTHEYGKLGLKATSDERVLLARLFWFTVEFGLINTPQGVRAYGGGILSSKEETVYAVESSIPERRPFDLLDVLQTSYHIDQIQPIYYVMNSFDQLYDLTHHDLLGLIRQLHAKCESKPKHPC